ncbi:MAG: hypothetical protein ACE37J_11950 [Pikeienuella sp.]|uniref:hypothetical protein n=1 Tax=Pikeienuella sp. TaxID=2831957 RepID=UPI00391D1B46
MTIELNWIMDPGHGWLIISRGDLKAAGLTEADISPYSYQKGDQLALEEDSDAAIYIAARYPGVRVGAMKHNETLIEVGGPRTWASFGTKPYGGSSTTGDAA